MTTASRWTCHASPHCAPPQLLGEALGFHGGGPSWSWLHLGPIEPGLVPIVEHRGRNAVTRRLVHDSSLARFAGCHLDLLGSASPTPGVDANYHGMASFWYVYAVAWRTPDGPRVHWHVDSSGVAGFAPWIPGRRPLAADRRLLTRLEDLLTGQISRAGRHARVEDDPEIIKQIVESANAMKAANRKLSWEIIASVHGVTDRSLRNYRADDRRGLLTVDSSRATDEVRRIS
jgi:hypothetical protein